MTEDKMREILGGEARIPQSVNQRIQDTCISLEEVSQDYKRGIRKLSQRKVCAAAVLVLVLSIFTALNWESVYAFAEGIIVGREGFLVEKLPDVHYIQGRIPGCDCGRDDIHTHIEKYDSMNEVEKEFGVKLLKNRMAKQKAPVSDTIAAFFTFWDGVDAYDGEINIEYPHYIISGVDDITYLPDGGITWKYKENEVILDLEVLFYVANNDARKKIGYEEIDSKTDICYYNDDMVGKVAVWKQQGNEENLYARFVYKDIIYELSGEADLKQMMEAIALFYE